MGHEYKGSHRELLNVTPFFAAQYEDKHLAIPQSLAKNIEYDWYESGHMVYVRDESLKQLHDRVAAFIKSSGQ